MAGALGRTTDINGRFACRYYSLAQPRLPLARSVARRYQGRRRGEGQCASAESTSKSSAPGAANSGATLRDGSPWAIDARIGEQLGVALLAAPRAHATGPFSDRDSFPPGRQLPCWDCYPCLCRSPFPAVWCSLVFLYVPRTLVGACSTSTSMGGEQQGVSSVAGGREPILALKPAITSVVQGLFMATATRIIAERDECGAGQAFIGSGLIAASCAWRPAV